MSVYAIEKETLDRLANAVRARFDLDETMSVEEMIAVITPHFTNLLLSATTTPGGSEVYGNGAGYLDGYRWSASGQKETSSTEGRITGWMPHISGAVCRVKGFDVKTVGYVTGLYYIGVLPNGSYEVVTFTIGSAKWPLTYDEETRIAEFSLPVNTCTHFRISSLIGPGAPIVTLNEEITGV